MQRTSSLLTISAILLLCCSAASAQILLAEGNPAADGQQPIFKVVNGHKPVCVAAFQTNDAGMLLTLSTYYAGSLQTLQVVPPLVLHYKTTTFFALFEPLGTSPTTACMSVPTSFLSDPTRKPRIFETLTGGDGPAITISQFAAAFNIAVQPCAPTASFAQNISTGAGGAGGSSNGGAGGSSNGGAGGTSTGGAGGSSGVASVSISNTTVGAALTITQGNPNGGNASGGNGGNASGGNGGNASGGNGGNASGGNGGNANNASFSAASTQCTNFTQSQGNNTTIQDATAIVTFGFAPLDFEDGDAALLTAALMNCAAPSFQTGGATMTLSCKLPTTGGVLNQQFFH